MNNVVSDEWKKRKSQVDYTFSLLFRQSLKERSSQKFSSMPLRCINKAKNSRFEDKTLPLLCAVFVGFFHAPPTLPQRFFVIKMLFNTLEPFFGLSNKTLFDEKFDCVYLWPWRLQRSVNSAKNASQQKFHSPTSYQYLRLSCSLNYHNKVPAGSTLSSELLLFPPSSRRCDIIYLKDWLCRGDCCKRFVLTSLRLAEEDFVEAQAFWLKGKVKIRQNPFGLVALWHKNLYRSFPFLCRAKKLRMIPFHEEESEKSARGRKFSTPEMWARENFFAFHTHAICKLDFHIFLSSSSARW